MTQVTAVDVPLEGVEHNVPGEPIGVVKFNQHNQTITVLVKTEDGDTTFECGAETAGGVCSRAVEDPDGVCWQHG